MLVLVSYVVLVNGSAKGWVKALRGLRQGWVETELGYLICNLWMMPYSFSNTRKEDLQTLKSLLLAFGHISGLKVNLDKNNIYGINLDQAHLSRLAEMLDCKASD
ncbi:hypothetical protein CK203_079743 [Vitis vinifera]|uniref:Reverse transcriptase domain-containing protein n=1 Tax=Vitis vinifera TaxID=29760 RepID=A0A438ECQ1_VITVI|nr:hypothetical protein CK203_079743 [Vitis vinifera]